MTPSKNLLKKGRIADCCDRLERNIIRSKPVGHLRTDGFMGTMGVDEKAASAFPAYGGIVRICLGHAPLGLHSSVGYRRQLPSREALDICVPWAMVIWVLLGIAKQNWCEQTNRLKPKASLEGSCRR